MPVKHNRSVAPLSVGAKGGGIDLSYELRLPSSNRNGRDAGDDEEFNVDSGQVPNPEAVTAHASNPGAEYASGIEMLNEFRSVPRQ